MAVVADAVVDRGVEDGGRDPRAERSRAAALDAALRLLIDEGWDALTQNRVAQLAGVGRATVYRHWPDRVDLLRDALHHAARATPTEVVATGDLRRDLRRVLWQMCEQLADHGLGQLLAVMVDRAERDGEIRVILEGLVGERLDAVRDLLAGAVSSGQLAPGLDVRRASSELIGPLAFRRLVSCEPLSRAFANGIVDDFLAAHA